MYVAKNNEGATLKRTSSKQEALESAQWFTIHEHQASIVERHRHEAGGILAKKRIIMYFTGYKNKLNYIEY